MAVVRPHQFDVPNVGDAGNNSIIINGQLDIWQRGTTFTSITENSFTADRFRYREIGTAVHDVSRSTDVPTNISANKPKYSLKVVTTTASATTTGSLRCLIEQPIEGYFSRHIQDEVCTLSFWVKSNKIGTYCVSFQNGNFSRSYITEYTINVINTWELKQISVPLLSSILDLGSDTTGARIQVRWVLMAGTGYQNTPNTWHSLNVLGTSSQTNFNDTVGNEFYLTSADFRIGDHTKLELPRYSPRMFPEELRLCQRYYEKSYDHDINPATTGAFGYTYATSINPFSHYLRILSTGVSTYNTTPALFTISSPSGATPTTFYSQLMVFVNGVKQIEGDDYSFRGNDLTDQLVFYSIPATGSIIELLVNGADGFMVSSNFISQKRDQVITMVFYNNTTGSVITPSVSTDNTHTFTRLFAASNLMGTSYTRVPIHWTASNEL